MLRYSVEVLCCVVVVLLVKCHVVVGEICRGLSSFV